MRSSVLQNVRFRLTRWKPGQTHVGVFISNSIGSSGGRVRVYHYVSGNCRLRVMQQKFPSVWITAPASEALMRSSRRDRCQDFSSASEPEVRTARKRFAAHRRSSLTPASCSHGYLDAVREPTRRITAGNDTPATTRQFPANPLRNGKPFVKATRVRFRHRPRLSPNSYKSAGLVVRDPWGAIHPNCNQIYSIATHAMNSHI
jgi:hypothetical protein